MRWCLIKQAAPLQTLHLGFDALQLYFQSSHAAAFSLFETESTGVMVLRSCLAKGQPILRYFRYFKSYLFSFF
jgi:hypothetical protein